MQPSEFDRQNVILLSFILPHFLTKKQVCKQPRGTYTKKKGKCFPPEPTSTVYRQIHRNCPFWLMKSRGRPPLVYEFQKRKYSLVGGCMLMNSRGRPPFVGLYVDEFQTSRGGPHFGELYVDEFQRRIPFWGLYIDEFQRRTPHLERGFASRDNFYGSSGTYDFCHRLRTLNEGINQKYLKNWADVADNTCFGRTVVCILVRIQPF